MCVYTHMWYYVNVIGFSKKFHPYSLLVYNLYKRNMNSDCGGEWTDSYDNNTDDSVGVKEKYI